MEIIALLLLLLNLQISPGRTHHENPINHSFLMKSGGQYFAECSIEKSRLNIQIGTEKAKPSILEGKWQVYETYENKKQIFIMNRVPKKEEEDFMDRFGHFMEFNPDGTYTEYASAQCGLDDNRFSYSGLWRFDSLILDLGNIKVENDRPNIYNKYKVRKGGKLKFISQKENELQFEIIKHWEGKKK